MRRTDGSRNVEMVNGLRQMLRPLLVRAVMVRAGAALMAIVLLTAFFAGGSRYFYCPVMKVAMTTSCCSGKHAGDEPGAEPRDALVAPDCCQARSVATVPSTPIPSPQEELVSPLAATLPAVAIVANEPAARQVARFTHPVRAGPTTPSARRAQLMIWTC